ncbi:hypothetical protein ACGFIF_20590 [Kribbella sp. NPDC049174]
MPESVAAVVSLVTGVVGSASAPQGRTAGCSEGFGDPADGDRQPAN